MPLYQNGQFFVVGPLANAYTTYENNLTQLQQVVLRVDPCISRRDVCRDSHPYESFTSRIGAFWFSPPLNLIGTYNSSPAALPIEPADRLLKIFAYADEFIRDWMVHSLKLLVLPMDGPFS